MTLKYESEILFDLMKRDGEDTPSDVLPYESELKEKYLQQVDGAYPKLMDYRPEWLYYNLYSHLPADFPVETLSNVTRATVDNVVPYAYGKANLKGLTLVNIPSKNYSETAKEISSWVVSYDESFILKPNTKYYIGIFNYSTESKVYGVRVNPFKDDQKVTIQAKGYGYLIATTVDSITSNALVVNKATHTQNNNAKFLFIEYQEGMENWDIPYFEGMKSVQMPSLTTSGKNLYNPDTAYVSGNKKQDVNNKVDVRPNTEYTFYANGHGWTQAILYNKERQVTRKIGQSSTSTKVTFTTTNDEVRVELIFLNGNNSVIENVDFTGIQFEYGEESTSYEPYQTIILTVNEPVELRGIGDVKDELNLLTGELTQRIGEVSFKGALNEGWGRFDNSAIQEKTCLFAYYSGLPSFPSANLEMISDKFAISKNGYSALLNTDEEMVHVYSDKTVYFRVLKSKLSTQNVDGFKKWLSQNPFTIQYQLKTESVKTVDLTVTDQDGNAESIIRPLEGTMHVSTSSQALPPLLDMIVPVEATTQNLMSFVNMKEEEK